MKARRYRFGASEITALFGVHAKCSRRTTLRSPIKAGRATVQGCSGAWLSAECTALVVALQREGDRAQTSYAFDLDRADSHDPAAGKNWLFDCDAGLRGFGHAMQLL
jgi:hypothetical protein